MNSLIPSGGLLRKSWVAWREYSGRRVDVRHRLMGAVMMMGGMRLAQCFYWWLALSQYLGHINRSFATIQTKVGGTPRPR